MEQAQEPTSLTDAISSPNFSPAADTPDLRSSRWVGSTSTRAFILKSSKPANGAVTVSVSMFLILAPFLASVSVMCATMPTESGPSISIMYSLRFGCLLSLVSLTARENPGKLFFSVPWKLDSLSVSIVIRAIMANSPPSCAILDSSMLPLLLCSVLEKSLTIPTLSGPASDTSTLAALDDIQRAPCTFTVEAKTLLPSSDIIFSGPAAAPSAHSSELLNSTQGGKEKGGETKDLLLLLDTNSRGSLFVHTFRPVSP
mmetsp:Transcript_5735/g.17083  ORF Transcript_5735/g.17083 Transcript_5735/m.17083 type:complete len:257 (+) Transcript_5735:81-851(+)